MNSPKKLVIASRESALAMWQARHIQARLQALYPTTQVEILGMTTTGDQILDSPLSRIGGKGLFVKELEQALADGSADFTKETGLTLDLTARGMGLRSNRYSMLIKDGKVVTLNIEGPGKFEVSDADTLLSQVHA